jgi:hypothetical protein
MPATWLITAAYADVVDLPQVYETTVEADTEEEAIKVAQDQCRDDNGWEPNDADPLCDVFARPVPPRVFHVVICPGNEYPVAFDVAEQAQTYAEENAGTVFEVSPLDAESGASFIAD